MSAEDSSNRDIDFESGERTKQGYFDELAGDVIVTSSKFGEAIIENSRGLRKAEGIFLNYGVNELANLYFLDYIYAKKMVLGLISNVSFLYIN